MTSTDQQALCGIAFSNSQANCGPMALRPLQCRLEDIRKQQVQKNQQILKGLGPEQQRQIDLLTVAIVERIIGKVENEWQLAATAGEECRLCQVVSRLWGTT